MNNTENQIVHLNDFIEYCKKQVEQYWYISASFIVGKSFYKFTVIKPKEITIKQFDWLHSIACKEIKLHKQYLLKTYFDIYSKY